MRYEIGPSIAIVQRLSLLNEPKTHSLEMVGTSPEALNGSDGSTLGLHMAIPRRDSCKRKSDTRLIPSVLSMARASDPASRGNLAA